jgi:hypothetical protein
MDENVAASVLSQVCNLLQLLCGHAGPGRAFRGCEADLLRLWANGRRNALDIEPEPVELQIYQVMSQPMARRLSMLLA